MKKYLLILVSIISLNVFYAQDNSIVGTWEGDDNGETARFIFDSDDYVYLTMEGVTYGGPSYDMNGTEASLIYKVDYSKSPNWIDFVINIKEDNSSFDMMKGILEFQDNYTTLKICLNFSEESNRPTNFFSENNDTFVLKKIE